MGGLPTLPDHLSSEVGPCKHCDGGALFLLVVVYIVEGHIDGSALDQALKEESDGSSPRVQVIRHSLHGLVQI